MKKSEDICREFSLDEIKAATRNFDEELIIGRGGFGFVYKGSINNGAEVVAMKRLSFKSNQGETEFLREIQTLSKLQHAHLVNLKGYCNESQEMILVYEYMPNGTLVDHLYKIKDLGPATGDGHGEQYGLTWKQRLNICIGAAHGVDFLHRVCVPGIIHRDIKDSNILLDENLVAKIADFGLAKLVKTTSELQTTNVSSTGVKGTFGYMDPEYFYTQRLSKKTDVYAFGVLLLVVLCGRPALDNKATDDRRSLVDWAQKCIQKNRVVQIIDPHLAGKVSSRSLKQFLKVIQKCLRKQSEQRPTMEEVISGLELALREQPTSYGTKKSKEPSGASSGIVMRRDPYEVLSVSRDSTYQEIKTVYRKLALKYHPDKNSNNPEASDLFKEVAFSYSILSDPEKRKQYDNGGFEALDGINILIDLSDLGTVNTVFATLFNKLGVPIKTTISTTVLEEASSGTVIVRPLPIGMSVSGKVEKQSAHFFGVTINDEEAKYGIVVRVTSAAQSKFKLLYFEQESNGGYGLALQEDSGKTGKVTSAGMYFLHFQVYRMDATRYELGMTNDPESALFKMLEGLQPCEVSGLKAGTHIFAIYGDNYFKTSSYKIEALCARSCADTAHKLKDIESEIWKKKNEMLQFEIEYRNALASFQEATNRYNQDKHSVDELLKQRNSIQSSFTVAK